MAIMSLFNTGQLSLAHLRTGKMPTLDCRTVTHLIDDGLMSS
jgi:hypothetical protein